MKKLSPQETDALKLLSRGIGYAEISEKLRIPLATLYTVTDHIRKKTGILDTKDVQQCRDYFRATRQLANPLEPVPVKYPVTEKQLEIMRLFASGETFSEIALSLGIGWQTAQNHCSIGCGRAGIRVSRSVRRGAILEWLSGLEREELEKLSPMADPMF